MSSGGPPKIVSASNLPPETTQAVYELIAQALREQTPLLNITVHNVTYEGLPIGEFEISVRKLDD